MPFFQPSDSLFFGVAGDAAARARGEFVVAQVPWPLTLSLFTGLTGVWVAGKKIAAIGVGASRYALA